jgi:hypothetical protein
MNAFHALLRLSIFAVCAVAAAYFTDPTPTEGGDPPGEIIYGITFDTLERFDSANPDTVTTVGPVTGLQPGESLRAIDFRPATRELYGIGSSGRLYEINPATAAVTPVGVPFALADPVNASMDFNPVADRIRVVSSDDENFRLNPDTGEVSGTDTPLAYDAGDVNSGENPYVSAIGYTENFAGAATTSLFGIDFNLQALVRQGGVGGSPSPNLGTLHTIGGLGVTAINGAIGLDIAANNSAYSLMHIVGAQGQRLYRVNLVTGAAQDLGFINSLFALRDIAVQPPPVFGDVNCLAGVNSVDALLVLRANASLSVNQVEPCVNIGAGLPNLELQGDVDCSDQVNAVDALKLLRYAAALTYSQVPLCPAIGT